jgi:AcrR family transcriptional regulator
VPRLTDAIKRERRRRLVEAARRCIAREGFRSLTVQDVCVEAGVSKGAFYTYFAHKRDLLLALIDEESEGVRELMRQLERTHGLGTERLRRFARAMLERGENPESLQIRADLWSELPSDPEIGDRWRAVVAERRVLLQAWIDEAVTAGELVPLPTNALAAILLALGDGLMLHAGLDPGGFRWSNVRKALDTLLQGIAR